MTTTTTNPQRARRVADLWARNPTATEAEVVALVDAELEAEAADRAEGEAWARDMGDSINRHMFTCGLCGGSRMPTAPNALCQSCATVVLVAQAERAGAEVVRDGRTRSELVALYLNGSAS
jgi:hypothetical protein